MGASHNVVLVVRRVKKRMFIPAVKDQQRLYPDLMAVAAAVKYATEVPG
jgi:hypothetical protein